MPIVHLEATDGGESYRREHPAFPLETGDLRFSSTEPERADWLVKAYSLDRPVTTFAPRERRILLVNEPNGYFPDIYVNQFGILISPFSVPEFRGVWHQSHGALPSFLGLRFSGKGVRSVMDYQALMTLPIPQKRPTVSVVVSSKSILPGHRRRLRFVRQLSSVLGPRLEVHGRGFRPIADKADAILPYQYHLVLENTVMPSYWTEKLADAWLGYAFPFVSGPPDLARSFPAESFLPIDIDDPAAAIESIVRALDTDLFSKRFDAILEARTRLMRDERLCPLIARVIRAHPSNEPRLPEAETIGPRPKRSALARTRREFARIYWQIASRLPQTQSR